MSGQAEALCEIWRGPILESVHQGHAVVCDETGQIVKAWGDPSAVILPRSSAKMIQALPLVASGAADAMRLSTEQLALACASHNGAPIHVEKVNKWLGDLDLGDDHLICGPQSSRDRSLRHQMIRDGQSPCRVHNNCSGKHTGFLALSKYLGVGLDYVDLGHPVQAGVKQVFEEITQEASPGHGIDGCSAPNFACTVLGLARAMAWFASAGRGGDAQSKAAVRLVDAMYKHPELVAGEGRACTGLMRSVTEPVAVKTGAEGVFVAILPKRRMGVALKAADGATRAAECAMAAILVGLGVADPKHPDVAAFLTPDIKNWDGLVTGRIRPAPPLLHGI
jgi:L-asparaginase II